MVLGDLAHRGATLWGRRVASAGTAGPAPTSSSPTARPHGRAAGRRGRRRGTRLGGAVDQPPRCRRDLPRRVTPRRRRRAAERAARRRRAALPDRGRRRHPRASSIPTWRAGRGQRAWRRTTAGRSATTSTRAVAACRAAARGTRPAHRPTARASTCTRRGRPARPRAACSPSGAGWPPTPTWPSRSASVPDDVLLGLYPFFHVAGLGIVLAHLTVGARVVIPASADAEEIWRLVGEESLTTISLPGPEARARPPDGGQGRPLIGTHRCSAARRWRR